MRRWWPGQGSKEASWGTLTNLGSRLEHAGHFRQILEGGAFPPDHPETRAPSDQAVRREGQKTGQDEHRAHEGADDELVEPGSLFRDVMGLCHGALSV